MPVLHKYKKGNIYYIFTEIKGKIIAFQLTREGEKKLKSAGIFPGRPFGRAILLDLYRSGNAYTYGKAIAPLETETYSRQLAFDFSKDPEPETLFPLCAICSSPDDLHLVEVRNEKHYASILCGDCRTKERGFIDTSIPLPLVTQGVLKRVLEMKNIKKEDATVSNYEALLNKEFKKNGDSKAKKRRLKQEELFGTEGDEKTKPI